MLCSTVAAAEDTDSTAVFKTWRAAHLDAQNACLREVFSSLAPGFSELGSYFSMTALYLKF